MSADLAKLNKRIEHFDHNIKKLNTILAEERQKLETLEDERANKQEETFARCRAVEQSNFLISLQSCGYRGGH